MIIRPKHKWVRVKDIPLVDSKFERIDQLIKNKDVLDCGCVGDLISSKKDFEKTSHAIHMKHAGSIVGVDILEEETKKRKEWGYNVVCANVENMELNRKFDVVIAADLIEHLSNPGMFLDTANNHLKDGGLLYLCTPNSHSLNNCIRALFCIKINVHPEHTCWYDLNTLIQLISRHGFMVREVYLQDYCERKIVNFILKFNKSLANSIIIIAEKKQLLD
jgi:2-polyprenyl-3-methyl-5-hydroxy-6-metoxy-1,4-benzoquinol methylase